MFLKKDYIDGILQNFFNNIITSSFSTVPQQSISGRTFLASRYLFSDWVVARLLCLTTFTFSAAPYLGNGR